MRVTSPSLLELVVSPTRTLSRHSPSPRAWFRGSYGGAAWSRCRWVSMEQYAIKPPEPPRPSAEPSKPMPRPPRAHTDLWYLLYGNDPE